MKTIADNLQVSHGFCLGAGNLSRIIQNRDITPFEGRWIEGYWSHTYWRFRFTLCNQCLETDAEGQLINAQPKMLEFIFESHWKDGVQIIPAGELDDAFKNGKLLDRYELAIHLTPTEAWSLWDTCRAMRGKPYDRAHLIAFYFWIHYWRRKNPKGLVALPTVPWFIRQMNDKYICSEATEESARDSGIPVDMLGGISASTTTTPNTQWFARRHIPALIDPLLLERRSPNTQPTEER